MLLNFPRKMPVFKQIGISIRKISETKVKIFYFTFLIKTFLTAIFPFKNLGSIHICHQQSMERLYNTEKKPLTTLSKRRSYLTMMIAVKNKFQVLGVYFSSFSSCCFYRECSLLKAIFFLFSFITFCICLGNYIEA